MSYLIDTNALSELKKRQPHPSVARWFVERPAASLCLSVLTLGELRKSIEAMPESQRKGSFLDGLTLVTRNVTDFNLPLLKIINPWEKPPAGQ